MNARKLFMIHVRNTSTMTFLLLTLKHLFVYGFVEYQTSNLLKNIPVQN